MENHPPLGVISLPNSPSFWTLWLGCWEHHWGPELNIGEPSATSKVYKLTPLVIGVARVLRLGGKCKTGPTYPLSKDEKWSDLVHYFLGRAQIHNKKCLAWGGTCQNWNAYASAVPTPIDLVIIALCPSVSVELNRSETCTIRRSIGACKT